MKLIRIIIIVIFVVSIVLSLLLYTRKNQRIEGQLGKKKLGWNPVAIKKILILPYGKDTILLSKESGVWKSNARFDARGIAPQLLVYLSTIEIENAGKPADSSLFNDHMLLRTFDKKGMEINTLVLGKELTPGICAAILNKDPNLKLLHSDLNKNSLRALLDSLL